MTKAGARVPRGLAGEIVALLSDAGRELTLSQIQTHLDGFRELPELSAAMIRLHRKGLVIAERVERPTDRGSRVVKCHQPARTNDQYRIAA